MPLMAAVKRLGPWAVLEYIINPALALITTPLIIKYLGLPTLGIWVLIITTTSFSVALASGVSVALSRCIAACGDTASALSRRIQLDALHIMAGASILSTGLAVGLLYLSGVPGFDYRNIDASLQIIVGATIIIDCFDGMYAGILRGKLRYPSSARVELIARLVQFGLTFLVLVIVPSLRTLALVTCIGSFIRLIFRYRLNDLSWIRLESIFTHRLQRDSPLLGTAGWATIQNLGSALYTSIDRLIISSAFGVTTLALYATASQLTNQIQAILGAAFSVQSNATAANPNSSGREEQIRQCLHISTAVAVGSIAAYGIFYIISEALFSAWLGTATSLQLRHLVPAVIIAAAVQTMVVPAHFVLLGLGRFKLIANLGLLAGVLSLALLWLSSIWLESKYALITRATYGVVLFSYFFFLKKFLQEHRY